MEQKESQIPPDEWETHLTLRPFDAPGQWEALQTWAAAHGWKCVHIVLSRGATPFQPMLTRRTTGNPQADVEKAARDAGRDVEAAGFSVSRIKIEAAPFNAVVPQTSRDARHLPNDRYFEHHVKLLLPASVDTTPLAAAAQAHNAHLSRNARRTRSDGQAERFVTQRGFHVGHTEARAQMDALLTALQSLPYPLLEVEEEFVVFDSNLALDAGWISEE